MRCVLYTNVHMRYHLQTTLGFVVASAVLFGSAVVYRTALAQPVGMTGDTQGGGAQAGESDNSNMSGVFGTVMSVSGNTFTLSPRTNRGGSSPAAYTVDASQAEIIKSGASASLANIMVGDSVTVMGVVNGANVTAISIRDGGTQGQRAQASLPHGNDQSVISGSITAVSGLTLTVTDKNGIIYTVDATKSEIKKKNVPSHLSSVVLGDAVVVQGVVNGVSVVASTVMDGGAPTAASQSITATNASTDARPGGLGGLLGGIGNFFHRLFSFL